MCIRPIIWQAFKARLNYTGKPLYLHKGKSMKPKLIKDLGVKKFTSKTNKQYYMRIGIFECPICKKEYETSIASVSTNKSTKCRNCANRKSSTKHTYHKHNAYKLFYAIKNRCYSKNNISYSDYGARGVTVCYEWMNNPIAFVEWALKNGYKNGLTIDKDIGSEELNINPPVYSPETCRFITQEENNMHKRLRIDNKSSKTGCFFDKSRNKYAASINSKGIKIYFKRFDTMQEAVINRNKFIIENNLHHKLNKE